MAPKAKTQPTLDAFFKKTAPKKRTHDTSEVEDVDAGATGGASAVAPVGGLADALSDPSWRTALAPVLASPLFGRIERFLDSERAAKAEVFPPTADIFAAFNATPLSKVKVVLIGQDPYHDNNQAHGMCFSVRPGIKPPPSLVNMYKELTNDIPGFVAPKHGYLKTWADQGVLLLNASLTVRAHQANSHSQCGWQEFTDEVIKYLNDNTSGLVFLLWGGFAQKKGARIDRAKHRVIEVAHPSPLSATKWFGCKTFSRCNAQLAELSKPPIDWKLPAEPVL